MADSTDALVEERTMMELFTAIFLFLKTGEKFATQDVAGPTVTAFTDYVGAQTSAKFEARILNEPNQAVELCTKQKVAVGIVNPGFFLTYEQALAMKPLLEVKRAGATGERYVLVAAKTASDKPADWAGKSVATALASEQRYVTGVILQDKFGDEVRLKRTADVESAVFDIAEHSAKAADGVLVEEAAWKVYAEDADLGPQLKVVFRSEDLLGALVVAFGEKAKGLDLDKLKTTLQTMHEKEDGKKLLQSIQVEAFQAIDEKRVSAAKETFHGK